METTDLIEPIQPMFDYTAGPWCSGEYRWLGLFYWQWMQPIGIGLMAASMLPFLYKYITAFRSGKFKTKKTLFYVGLIFFISIIITEILYIPCIYFYCWNPDLNNVFGVAVTQGYAFQTIMLIGMWSHRLYSISRATRLRISNVMMYTFGFLYVVICGFFAASGVMFQLLIHSIGPALWSLGFVGVLLLSMFLMAMFIYKLFRAYQGTKEASDDQRLIVLVTKTALLAIISTLCVIFSAVTSLLVPVTASPHVLMIFTWALSIDMWSNFICIYLSYQFSADTYRKLCGCCDDQCFKLWTRWAGNDDLKMTEQSIKSTEKSTTSQTEMSAATTTRTVSSQKSVEIITSSPVQSPADAPDLDDEEQP